MVLSVNYIKQFNDIDKIFKYVKNIDMTALTFKPQLQAELWLIIQRKKDSADFNTSSLCRNTLHNRFGGNILSTYNILLTDEF